MTDLEYLTTFSEVDGYTIAKSFKRLQSRGKDFERAQENLLKKVQEETKGKANILIELRYYETPKGNIVMSGKPVKADKK